MNTVRHDPAAAHVVVVGGGITGLSAAWSLQQSAAQEGRPLRYTLLEQGNRWGGKVQTEQVHGFGEQPFILEAGPDAFLTRKPWALELAQALGLGERIISTRRDHNRTFVLHHGEPVPLPEGLNLLVPTRSLPFLRSPLFSPWGKLRVGLEWFIPPRRDANDETLACFVQRRLGAEMLDKLGEPLLGGVYNGDPQRQSMQATFPHFPALEKQYGSLLRGMRRQPPAPSDLPPFISFSTGTHELVQALTASLSGDLRLKCAVCALEMLPGDHYGIVTERGDRLLADAVLLATPADVTASLLARIAPQAAASLQSIRYAGIGTLYLAYRREDVPHPLDGFGMVIPGSARRAMDGMTWTSSKWAQRAPDGHVLLRVFFGGPRTRPLLDVDDDQLLAAVRGELRTSLGIWHAPLFYRIYRWHDGYPQYDLGHLERVQAAQTGLPPGVMIAGSAYDGVGVPDCVRQGQAAASRILAHLTARQPEYTST